MWVEREAWILRLVDDDGRVGLGEAVLEPANGEVAETILTALVRETVEGAAGGLPSLADLEMHGAPGRALAAALESARFDLEGAATRRGRRRASASTRRCRRSDRRRPPRRRSSRSNRGS